MHVIKILYQQIMRDSVESLRKVYAGCKDCMRLLFVKDRVCEMQQFYQIVGYR